MNEINEKRLNSYIASVNDALEGYRELFSGENAVYQKKVVDAMWYSLSAGGKRIRPVLVQEFCRISGGSSSDCIAAAAAVEMIHTFSLIHDDLPCMDDDDLRRGKPSCHKQFGEAIALLAGDALENTAFEIISDDSNISDERKVRIIRELSAATGVFGMIGGQTIDMENIRGAVFPDSKLLSMYSMKTSALISASCRIGCICAGDYDGAVMASEYGEKLGTAFQIIDDILDIISTEDKLGKTAGSDERSGKCTYAALHGIDDSEKQARKLSDAAKKALDGFEDTNFLLELTDMLLRRKK